MRVDKEDAVDTIADIYRLGKKFYLQKGTPFVAMMRDSPVKDLSDAYRVAHENGQYFRFGKGGQSRLQFERAMIANGYVVLSNEWSRKGRYEADLERHGYEPFQLSKEPLFSNMHAGFILPKGAKFKQGTILNAVPFLLLGSESNPAIGPTPCP